MLMKTMILLISSQINMLIIRTMLKIQEYSNEPTEFNYSELIAHDIEKNK